MTDIDKTLRRFKRIRIALMRSPQFMECGPVMMLGTNRIDDSIPTACTDGRNETYGRAFIESLDDLELGFVIMHETMHKLCRHRAAVMIAIQICQFLFYVSAR